MATMLDKFVNELSWKTDDSGFNKAKKQTLNLAAGIAKLGAAYTAAAGFVTGFVASVNSQTAEQYRLSKSLGVSYDWLDRWSDATESLGIGSRGISDSFAFLNKTIGNAQLGKNTKEINKAFRAIGISLKSVKSINAEDRFDVITKALFGVKDASKRVSIATTLFGRGAGVELAKLGTYLESTGQSFEDYISRYDSLAFEDEKSAKGAADFTARMGELKQTFDEVSATIAGYIGEALTPMLKDLVTWIKNNRELIKTKIVEWAQKLAVWLKEVWRFLSDLLRVIAPLIEKVGGLGKVFKLLAIGYIAAKFGALAKNLGNCSISLSTLKGFFTGQAGITVLAGAAILSLTDLAESLDDVSNKSFGNEASKKAMGWIDDLLIKIAKLKGVDFKDEATKQLYIAEVDSKGFFAQVNTLIEKMDEINIQVTRGRDLWISAIQSVPKMVGFAVDSIKLLWSEVANGLDEIFNRIKANPVVSWLSKKIGGISFNLSGAQGYVDKSLDRPAPTQVPSARQFTPRQAPMQSTRYFNSTSVTAPITINAAPGQSAKSIAQEVKSQLEYFTANAVRAHAGVR